MKNRPRGKIIARCPEFVCVEYPDGQRVVESSPEVRRALQRAQFGISDAGDAKKRVDLADALLSLAEYAAGQEVERTDLLERLSMTLGTALAQMLSVTPLKQDKSGRQTLADSSLLVSVSKERQRALAQYSEGDPAKLAISPQKQRYQAELLGESLAAEFKNALLGLVRWKYPCRTNGASSHSTLSGWCSLRQKRFSGKH